MRTLRAIAILAVAVPLAVVSVLAWACLCHYDDLPIRMGEY